MKKTYGLIALGFLIAIVLLLIKTFSISQTQPEKIAVSQTPTPTMDAPKNVDYKARFAIFTNGTKRIFTASMYHNLSKDVYLEGSDPSIVHVKKDGATWMDFFATLPFKLRKDCLTTGTNETFCTTKNAINNGDWALISYGTENEAQIKPQLNSLKLSNE